MKANSEKVKMFGIEIDNVSACEAVEKIALFLKTARFHHMVVSNAARISHVKRDNELMHIYRNADLMVADGVSITLSSAFLGQPIKERLIGADLLTKILEFSASNSIRVFILKGGESCLDSEIRAGLLKKFPSLLIAGIYFVPYDFDIERGAHENVRIFEEACRARAEILIVSMGSPKGEKWIWRNRGFLKDIPTCFELGAAIDYVTGRVRWPPRWIQAAGLEWLYRLCCQPHRMWKRCLIDNSFFVWIFAKEFFKHKFR